MFSLAFKFKPSHNKLAALEGMKEPEHETELSCLSNDKCLKIREVIPLLLHTTPRSGA